MRLIDAEALKERLLGYKVPDEPILNQAHKELIEAIDSLPTVCDIEQIRDEIEESVTDYILYEPNKEIAAKMFKVMDKALEIIDKYTK